VEEWQRTHVIEKLKQDIRSFPLRMLRARLLNAGKWEPKIGGLEEKVSLLKLRLADLNVRVRPSNEHSKDKTEAQVSRQTDQGDSRSEGLRMRLTKAQKKD
jgi:hypothetical protein